MPDLFNRLLSSIVGVLFVLAVMSMVDMPYNPAKPVVDVIFGWVRAVGIH